MIESCLTSPAKVGLATHCIRPKIKSAFQRQTPTQATIDLVHSAENCHVAIWNPSLEIYIHKAYIIVVQCASCEREDAGATGTDITSIWRAYWVPGRVSSLAWLAKSIWLWLCNDHIAFLAAGKGRGWVIWLGARLSYAKSSQSL